MTTIPSASLLRHSRSIEPTWLAHALTVVLVWVWLSHAPALHICDSDARHSPRAEDPALTSQG